MKFTSQSAPRCATLADADGPRPASPRWFLTGPATAEDLTATDPRIADLVVHAKSMGMNVSACGLTTTTWTKLWGIPFEAAPFARRCWSCSYRIRGMESGSAPDART